MMSSVYLGRRLWDDKEHGWYTITQQNGEYSVTLELPDLQRVILVDDPIDCQPESAYLLYDPLVEKWIQFDLKNHSVSEVDASVIPLPKEVPMYPSSLDDLKALSSEIEDLSSLDKERLLEMMILRSFNSLPTAYETLLIDKFGDLEKLQVTLNEHSQQQYQLQHQNQQHNDMYSNPQTVKKLSYRLYAQDIYAALDQAELPIAWGDKTDWVQKLSGKQHRFVYTDSHVEDLARPATYMKILFRYAWHSCMHGKALSNDLMVVIPTQSGKGMSEHWMLTQITVKGLNTEVLAHLQKLLAFYRDRGIQASMLELLFFQSDNKTAIQMLKNKGINNEQLIKDFNLLKVYLQSLCSKTIDGKLFDSNSTNSLNPACKTALKKAFPDATCQFTQASKHEAGKQPDASSCGLFTFLNAWHMVTTGEARDYKKSMGLGSLAYLVKANKMVKRDRHYLSQLLEKQQQEQTQGGPQNNNNEETPPPSTKPKF